MAIKPFKREDVQIPYVRIRGVIVWGIDRAKGSADIKIGDFVERRRGMWRRTRSMQRREGIALTNVTRHKKLVTVYVDQGRIPYGKR